MDAFTALPFSTITGSVALPKNARPPVARAKQADPALTMMTDFTTSAMFSIEEEVQIDQALEYMKAVGVKLLFVLDDAGKLTGLITTTDIQGGKPTRYLHSGDASRAHGTRADVLVKHIMSAVSDWIVLDFPLVQKANIAQLITTFKTAGMRHLVVTDGPPNARAVRGVISATRVEQSLGITLDIVRRATTFAEIESAVVGS